MSKQLIKLLAETGNTKLDKTRTDQILIAGLSLAPAMESGTELCPSRSKGCTSVCLFDQGRGKFSNVRQARIKKAQLFLENRRLFLLLCFPLNGIQFRFKSAQEQSSVL